MTQEITIDASNRSIGSVATEVSSFLNGKHMTDYSAHQMPNVKVTVTNASQLKVGAKLDKKIYYHHTEYVGHLKKKTMKQVIETHGYSGVLKKAVSGMLPKNRLRERKLKNLIIEE